MPGLMVGSYEMEMSTTQPLYAEESIGENSGCQTFLAMAIVEKKRVLHHYSVHS